MLLAPGKASYDDTETKKDFYALYEAIRSGDDAFAKEVFVKYHVDSDHYESFETDLDYAMDIDRDGVYMYEIIPARKKLSMMTFEDCIRYWNDNAPDRHHQLAEIHDMDDKNWWDHLADALGLWNLINAISNSRETFDTHDLYFLYIEDDGTFLSFSNKTEMLSRISEEWFIDNLENAYNE